MPASFGLLSYSRETLYYGPERSKLSRLTQRLQDRMESRDPSEHAVAKEEPAPPAWEPWAPPEDASALSEFRSLVGLQRSATAGLPSPVSGGDRSIQRPVGGGLFDNSVGYMPESPAAPARTAGAAARSRKDDVPTAGPAFSADLADKVAKIRAAFKIPRTPDDKASKPATKTDKPSDEA